MFSYTMAILQCINSVEATSLYAVAHATATAFGQDPISLMYVLFYITYIGKMMKAVLLSHQFFGSSLF